MFIILQNDVRKMAEVRSCYYEWLHSPKTDREKENETYITLLKAFFEKRRGSYGMRRLKNKFSEQDILIN